MSGKDIKMWREGRFLSDIVTGIFVNWCMPFPIAVRLSFPGEILLRWFSARYETRCKASSGDLSVQWNLDLAKYQGTGEIVSLYRGLVITNLWKKTKKQRKNKHYNNQTKQNKRDNPKFRHIGANVYLKIGLLRDGDDEVNFWFQDSASDTLYI